MRLLAAQLTFKLCQYVCVCVWGGGGGQCVSCVGDGVSVCVGRGQCVCEGGLCVCQWGSVCVCVCV